MTLTAYTDGSSHIVSQEAWWGGWAYAFLWDGEVVTGSGAGRLKTGAAELTAMLELLGALYHDMPAGVGAVEVVSDSQYAVDCLLNGAALLAGRGFVSPRRENHMVRKALEETVAGLWEDKGVKVGASWVKGHAGDPLNEEADRLAGEAMRAFREVQVDYKLWQEQKARKKA